MCALTPYAPLHVIGLGPGDGSLLAPAALLCLESSFVIAGYSGYVKLLPGKILAGKEIISTGMRQERQRVDAAIESSLAGKETCLICSGDPGIYAMAGLALELLEKRGLCAGDFPLDIVPGIPAVCAAAALLGAPLGHDFACVSLSDLLTPWEIIRKRLENALAGDFVLVLYNPRSRSRTKQLDETLELALRRHGPELPVGIVGNAYREGQSCRILPLSEIAPESIDMFTILLLGNSFSRIIPGVGESPLSWECGARILTPRGY